MKSLFIIGNGFDCYGHKMKTQYIDFKEYLIKKFPNYNGDFDGIPEATMLPDGGEEYDLDEVVGLIIRTIDECSKPYWGNLEECLGNEFIDNIAYDNEWAYKITDDSDEEDDEIFHSVYENEDLSESIIGAYRILTNLFQEWVFNDLALIDFKKVKKFKKKPSFKKSLFLSFNYTSTLEALYNVSASNICYIHGKAKDKDSQIYFGHGNDEEFSEFIHYLGISDAYNRLKIDLRKNTRKALSDNYNFFERISGVRKIYSYGFSFSNVDMIYLEEICKHIEPNKVRWYFNKYDWKNNQDSVNKVRNLGFKIRISRRWKDSDGKKM